MKDSLAAADEVSFDGYVLDRRQTSLAIMEL